MSFYSLSSARCSAAWSALSSCAWCRLTGSPRGRRMPMRKRNVQILFRLTEEEADYLCSLAERSGHSRQALLQSMVMGYRLCEKPDPEFYKIMRELSAIGNRINQLAAKANALDFVDAPMLREEAKRWRDFRLDVSKCYLLPRKQKGWWRSARYGMCVAGSTTQSTMPKIPKRPPTQSTATPTCRRWWM